MDLDTPALRRIQFVRHKVVPHRRHYVTEEDVKVVLSRLPEELWSRLRKVHFKDDARGNRRFGYTTTRGRREVSLCALPIRVSLNTARCKPSDFGALAGSQWPTLAVRRFMLYDVLLHELGHLQIILPQAKNPKRKFASETEAQEFADIWRKQLWSTEYPHPDLVHNPPSDEELRALRTNWINANLVYKRGQALDAAGKWKEAGEQYCKAIELYPAHALALEGLGTIMWTGEGGLTGREARLAQVDLLREALRLDPSLPEAALYLALGLSGLGRQDEARDAFKRAIELDPRHYRAMDYFADELTDWGCWEEAEAILTTVMSKRPQWMTARAHYARLLMMRSNRPSEAELQKVVELLEKVVAADPKDADAHLGLATAFSKLPGCTAKAIQHAKKAVSLHPDNAAAAALLARLTANETTQG